MPATRELLTEREYAKLKKDPEKAIEVLGRYVERQPGRPLKPDRLTNAERQRMWRERRKAEREGLSS